MGRQPGDSWPWPLCSPAPWSPAGGRTQPETKGGWWWSPKRLASWKAEQGGAGWRMDLGRRCGENLHHNRYCWLVQTLVREFPCLPIKDHASLGSEMDILYHIKEVFSFKNKNGFWILSMPFCFLCRWYSVFFSSTLFIYWIILVRSVLWGILACLGETPLGHGTRVLLDSVGWYFI